MSDEPAVDDRGTDQETAANFLCSLRDQAFKGSDELLALALGRSTDETRALCQGDAIIDDDVVMKARGIARQRGVES